MLLSTKAKKTQNNKKDTSAEKLTASVYVFARNCINLAAAQANTDIPKQMFKEREKDLQQSEIRQQRQRGI